MHPVPASPRPASLRLRPLRGLLSLFGALCGPLLAAAQTSAAGQFPDLRTPPSELRAPGARSDFRFALTGDSILNRRISVFSAPGFSDLVERLRGADAAFTNFETLIHHFEFPGEAQSGGTYMGSPPYIIDELKWLGIDLLGTANNHSFDFGVDGLRSTLKYLRDSGLTHAGTGETLARARAPAYLDTPKGRVALISCASTFPPASAAGPQRADLPGRPGLNPLRFTTTYTVDTATYETIAALAGLTRRSTATASGSTASEGEGAGGAGRGRSRGNRAARAAEGETATAATTPASSATTATPGTATATVPATTPAPSAAEPVELTLPLARATQFLQTRFQEGPANAVHTAPLASDLEAIAATVRDARQQADWVLVSIHCHEGAGGDTAVPAEFLVTFAHAMIDAGADLMVGHGPHVIRGIEVYKHKPIFYSIGNFVFENDLVLFQPQENYDAQNLPPTAQPSEYYSRRSRNDTISFPANQAFWESMMAEPTFDADRRLTSIRVYPLELGFKKPRPDRGRPYPASEPVGRAIIDRLNRLSTPYGTTVTYENGVGVAAWKP